MKPTSKSADTKLTAKQYEDLGRIVASVYENGYLDSAKSYKMTLLKGVVGGLGGVIGATIGVALLLWLLSLFSEIPFIGTLFDNLERTIDQR